MSAHTQTQIIVLDVLLPFRKKEDLEAMPDEREAIHSRTLEAQKDPRVGDALAALLTYHQADGILLQAHRQDSEHPFVHANPHLSKRLDAGSDEPDSGKTREPDQRSGKSGQVVVTAHFPKTGQPRSEEDLANSTRHLVNHMEALGWIHEHLHGRGYRSLNARGQHYDDLKAVAHHSWSCLFASAPAIVEIVQQIIILIAIVIIEQPSIRGIRLEGVPIQSFEGQPRSTGKHVDITGNQFASNMTLLFCGHPINYAYDTSGHVTVDTFARESDDPRMITPESGPFSVITAWGTSGPTSDFRVTAPMPTMSPVTIPAPFQGSPGAIFTLNGTNLWVTGTTVTFPGGNTAAVSFVSDTQIQVTVPPGAPPTAGPIIVQTAGGVASGPSFTYV